MRRAVTVLIAIALVVPTTVGLTGCSQGNEANAAVTAANKSLYDYSVLDRRTSVLLGQLLTVQPTGTSVNRGVQLLDDLDKVLVERDSTAKAAGADFQKILAMQVKETVRTYAKRAIAYTDSLVVLDTALKKLSADYRALFDHVKKKPDDLTGLSELTAAVDEQTKAVDAARVKAQGLMDSADKYYQQNLAGAEGSK
jgi:hypothetical protein